MMKAFVQKLRTAMRAMRALMSGVASAALVAVRGIDGAVSWIWQSIAGPPQVDYEEEIFDVPEIASPATDAETLDAGLRIVGEQAIRAAREVLAYGEVRSGDVGVDIAVWLQNLSREEVSAIAHGDELAVGRHVAGLDPVLDIIGSPIRRPEPEEDRARDKKRLREAEERRLSEQAAFARVRREKEKTPDAPALLPALTA